VTALVAVIEQFMPANGKLPDDIAPVTREEENGLRAFRRQAVKALAQYRGPAVTDAKGAITMKSALILLKIINNDGVVPFAKLDERIEAAWGVARIRSKTVPAYQPAYAAQQVGNVIVEMAGEAKKSDPRKFPWKYHAARLADALELMRADARDDPNKASDYINPMVTESLKILKEIETTEVANGATLKAFHSTTALPGGVATLYKNDPASVVRQPGDTAPPVKPMEKPGGKPDGTKPVKP